VSKRYLIRRLLLVVPVLLGTILLVYSLVFLMPGDPIRRLAGSKPLPESTVNAIKEAYHLNDPFLVQFGYYLEGLAHGDFGATFAQGRDVSSIIAERFPVTLTLAFGAFAVEVVLGLGLALLSAAKSRTVTDHVILGVTLVLITIPIIVLGFLLQYLFGVKFHLLPVAGTKDGVKSYILPWITLGIGSAASLGRLARSSVLDNMAGEHIRAGIARGLPKRRVMARHVLRNSLVPIVTIMGLDLAYLMGGAVFTERVFNLNGLGGALLFGIATENGPLVVGLVVLSTIIFVFMNLFVDLLCARIDPRISYE
jgi:oligopeptide transport system permease protein